MRSPRVLLPSTSHSPHSPGQVFVASLAHVFVIAWVADSLAAADPSPPSVYPRATAAIASSTAALPMRRTPAIAPLASFCEHWEAALARAANTAASAREADGSDGAEQSGEREDATPGCGGQPAACTAVTSAIVEREVGRVQAEWAAAAHRLRAAEGVGAAAVGGLGKAHFGLRAVVRMPSQLSAMHGAVIRGSAFTRGWARLNEHSLSCDRSVEQITLFGIKTSNELSIVHPVDAHFLAPPPPHPSLLAVFIFALLPRAF